MNVDEVITLDDNKEYVLLSQTTYEDEKYFLAALLVNNEPAEEYTIFKEVHEENETYVDEILDDNLKEKLIENFEQVYDEEEGQ